MPNDEPIAGRLLATARDIEGAAAVLANFDAGRYEERAALARIASAFYGEEVSLTEVDAKHVADHVVELIEKAHALFESDIKVDHGQTE